MSDSTECNFSLPRHPLKKNKTSYSEANTFVPSSPSRNLLRSVNPYFAGLVVITNIDVMIIILALILFKTVAKTLADMHKRN